MGFDMLVQLRFSLPFDGPYVIRIVLLLLKFKLTHEKLHVFNIRLVHPAFINAHNAVAAVAAKLLMRL